MARCAAPCPCGAPKSFLHASPLERRKGALFLPRGGLTRKPARRLREWRGKKEEGPLERPPEEEERKKDEFCALLKTDCRLCPTALHIMRGKGGTSPFHGWSAQILLLSLLPSALGTGEEGGERRGQQKERDELTFCIWGRLEKALH